MPSSMVGKAGLADTGSVPQMGTTILKNNADPMGLDLYFVNQYYQNDVPMTLCIYTVPYAIRL